MNQKQYVTDLIKDDYLNWKSGDKILLATPTGSGKTTFVVNVLLKNAMQQKKHVVYYCNRKVLYEQFSVQSKELIRKIFGQDLDIADDAENYLHIFTYQGSELTKNYPDVTIKMQDTCESYRLNKDCILYYVFDEAHYFINDALINNRTNFWLKEKFQYGISVFLTATPKPLLSLFAAQETMNAQWGEILYQNLINESKWKTLLKEIEPDLIDIMSLRLKKEKGIDEVITNRVDLVSEAVRRSWSALNPWYQDMESMFDSHKAFNYYYSFPPDYSYAEPVYFDEYEELLPEVSKNDQEKWLIFVDSEEDGIRMQSKLEEMLKMTMDHPEEINVIFLSSKKIRENRTCREIYNAIIENEFFPVKVLIATSVLDCGINICDPQVRNVVISNANESTFLQMLGRKRVASHEKIRLYIKTYQFLSIHNRFNTNKKDLEYLALFNLKNEHDIIQQSQKWPLTYTAKSHLPASNLKQLYDNYFNKKKALFVAKDIDLNPNHYGHIQSKNVTVPSHELYFRDFDISKTALINIIMQMHDYEQAMSAYRTFSENYNVLCNDLLLLAKDIQAKRIAPSVAVALAIAPDSFFDFSEKTDKKGTTIDFRAHMEPDDLFYLRYQLQWLGKEYDYHCWLNYDKKYQNIINYLESVAAMPYLREDSNNHEQRDFAQKCFELLIELPTCPKSLWRNKSRYRRRNTYPNMSKLNDCFEMLSIPYIISNKQKKYKGVARKKTCWIIQRKAEKNNMEEATANPK